MSAIGITPGRVTEIKIESKDMARGQVKRRKPLLPRPRRCLRTSQAHELVNWRHARAQMVFARSISNAYENNGAVLDTPRA